MKILYINSNFFAYNRIIGKQLCKDGFDVTNCEFVLPKMNYFRRIKYKNADIKFSTLARRKYIDDHILKLENAELYDIVLVSQMLLEKEYLDKLKRKFSRARFIRILLDDISFFDDEEVDTFPMYDVITSYYEEDAKKYGYVYNPNFYETEIRKPKKYDWNFIGTAPKHRIDILNKILQNNSQKAFLYIYSGYGAGPKTFFKQMVLRNVGETGINKFIFCKPLSQEKTCNIFAESKAIVDINHPWQKGLSFRPFHAMAMHTKLITTNEDIKNYDFYNPNNIWVLDKENPIMPSDEWMNQPYEEPRKEIFEFYSVASFCKRIEALF